MTSNPYQPPSEPSQVASKPLREGGEDPLRGPAYGCFFAALLMIFGAVVNFGMYWPHLKHGQRIGNEQIVEAAWREVVDAVLGFTLCILAFAVAWSMLRRRNRWLVAGSSVLGLFLCLPAPLAAVVLLRLRRKEVWESFERTQAVS